MDKAISQALKEKLDNYLNGSIANGWNLINQNDEGFIIEEKKDFSLAYYFISVVLATLILTFLFGFFLFWLILIMILFIFVYKGKTTRLYGRINYEENKILILKDGKEYKELKV